jgi:hypothetical protein
MKKHILIVILSFLGVMMMAQTQYVVTTSSLNVRSKASKNSSIIGRVQEGNIVVVNDINNGWAQINYNNRTAYVNAQYIEPHIASKEKDDEREQKSIESYFNYYATNNVGWMILPIFLLSIILCIIRHLKDQISPKAKLISAWSIFMVTAIIEIIYGLLMGSKGFWFFEIFGWFINIIIFIGIGYLIYNQIMCLFEILEAMQSSSNAFSMKIGGFSWLIFIIVTLLLSLFDGVEYFHMIFIPFVICQFIQICIILVSASKLKGFMFALLCLITYVIGSIGSAIFFAQYAMILIIIVILIMIVTVAVTIFGGALGGLAGGGGGNRGQLRDKNSDIVDVILGMDTKSGRFSNDELTFHADDGSVWKRSSRSSSDWHQQ